MIHYEESGQGHPVVLLHGGALDRRMWDDQVPAFERRHRVIRVDARGHGRSETPTTPANGFLPDLDALRTGKIDACDSCHFS